MYLDLHLSERTELRTSSRVDDTGRPFAEIQWDFHGPLPNSASNNVLWGTTGAMRRLAELILAAARLAEEEAAWQAHTATAAHHARAGGMSALLEAALGYAARGIPIYPAHWPRPPRTGPAWPGLLLSRGPGCDQPAKHPLVRHGVIDATTDPAQLERWWRRWPQANVGLATGIIFDALDIDGPAGLAALHQLAGTVGLRLPGPLVATGGRWLAPLVRPDQARQPPTPRPYPCRLARPRRLCAGPTKPPHLRPTLPLAA